MSPVRFHPEAEAELAAETAYYDECFPGLGQRFLREVQAAIELAASLPEVGAPYKYHRPRFPQEIPVLDHL